MDSVNLIASYSKIVIVFCIVVMTLFFIVTLIMVRSDAMQVVELMKLISAFYGGELMLLCLKRIFCK